MAALRDSASEPAGEAGTIAPQRPRPTGTLSALVVGTDDWAIEQSAASLSQDGHTVHRCHALGQAPFPCNALQPGGHCPLDGGVDVVVTTRARPIAVPTAGEIGVICALHAGVPLVISGIWRDGPFTDWAAATVPPDGDLAAACVEVVPASDAGTVIMLNDGSV